MGCLGFNTAAFALARTRNIFQWYGLEPRSISLPNGTTMHCWVPNNPNKRRPLVLLHAFGLYSLSWVVQIPSFTSAFDLYIPDLVFFGDSVTTSSERSEFYQAECVKQLMEAMGVYHFDVLGTSYGGFVAYRLAHMFPHFVGRIILSNSAPNKDPESDRLLVEHCKVQSVRDVLVPTSWKHAKVAFGLCFHKAPSILPDFVFKDYFEVVYTKNMKEKLEMLHGLVLGKANSPPLPKLTQEVLIIWGDKDKVFDIEYAYKLKQHLGEKARMIVIKNTAHAPQFEKASEYNKIVMTYLQSS